MRSSHLSANARAPPLELAPFRIAAVAIAVPLQRLPGFIGPVPQPLWMSAMEFDGPVEPLRTMRDYNMPVCL